MQASNDNERVVIEFFATLATGNLEAIREALHEEATWTPMVRGVPGAGKHFGRKGIVDEFLAPVRGLFRPGDPKVHMKTIASNGPLVLTETHGTGVLADGRQYENFYCWAVEVKDGKIFAIREYMDSFYVANLFAKQEDI
jgi:ketosteroid isomerase-like protein